MTQVIHINAAPWQWETNPEFVYIGRANPRKALEASVWGNPLKVGQHGTREEVVAAYRAQLLASPDLLERCRRELRGRTLVCWCKPEACHGDALAEIADMDEAEFNRLLEAAMGVTS